MVLLELLVYELGICFEVLFEELLPEDRLRCAFAGLLSAEEVEREPESQVINIVLRGGYDVVLAGEDAPCDMDVLELRGGLERVHLDLGVLLEVPSEHKVL